MRGKNRLRWRNRRDTLPARRHRRRQRRRDVERQGEYDPIEVHPSSVARGVRSRLVGALGALVVTLGCLGVGVATSLSTFFAVFALTIGLSSFGAGVALVMSARHEEKVHQIADQLDRGDLLESLAEEPSDGTDGTVA